MTFRIMSLPDSRDPLPTLVREACAPFRAELTALAAGMLGAMEAAHEILAPAADEPGPAGEAAMTALQILADAIASAKPPEPAPHV